MQTGANEEVFEEEATDSVPESGVEITESEDHWIDEAQPVRRSIVLPVLLILIAIGWTGFFLFAHRTDLITLPAPARIADMLVFLSVPLLLIGMLWLLMLRTSHQEARRFADVSLEMHHAGDMLENRMQSINNEISLAREFLGEQAREIDMLGRTRARDIREAAEAIEQALNESTQKAEKLDEVSRAANGNLERLRNHLPVVTSTTKDVTNQIAAAGSSVQRQVEELTRSAAEVEDAGSRLGEAIDALSQRSEEAAASISENGTASETRLENFLIKADRTSEQLSAGLQAAVADMLATLDDSAERQRRLAIDSANALRGQLERLDTAMIDVGNRGGEQGERIGRLAREIDDSAERASTRIEQLDETGSEATARIAFAISAALDNSHALGEALERNDGRLESLGGRSEQLREMLAEIDRLSEQQLQPGLELLGQRIDETISRSEALAGGIGNIDASSIDLHERGTAFGEMLAAQQAMIDHLINESGPAFAERRQDGVELEQTLMEARGALQRLSEDVEVKLQATIAQVRDHMIEAADHARGAMDGVVEQSASQLQARTSELLGAAVAEEMRGGASQWDALVSSALTLSDETTSLLETRLAKLEQMTSNLEVRLERAHEQFEGVDDDAFARRMLLLTESLNSTSIDVAKLLSNEVTDTAWAAYLKGDRGVFTRRAVRLLDAGEVRVVAQHYEDDLEFRNQVNRYIHDFENIMRNLMSTRDGSAIGVTLLSSDVGKLYVALAQAIERLRA